MKVEKEERRSTRNDFQQQGKCWWSSNAVDFYDYDL